MASWPSRGFLDCISSTSRKTKARMTILLRILHAWIKSVSFRSLSGKDRYGDTAGSALRAVPPAGYASSLPLRPHDWIGLSVNNEQLDEKKNQKFFSNFLIDALAESPPPPRQPATHTPDTLFAFDEDVLNCCIFYFLFLALVRVYFSRNRMR